MNTKNTHLVGLTLAQAFDKVATPWKKGDSRTAKDGQEVIIRSASSHPGCKGCRGMATCSLMGVDRYRLANRDGGTIQYFGGRYAGKSLTADQVTALLKLPTNTGEVFLPVTVRDRKGRVRKIQKSADGTSLEVRDHRRHLVVRRHPEGSTFTYSLRLTKANADGLLDAAAITSALFDLQDATILG